MIPWKKELTRNGEKMCEIIFCHVMKWIFEIGIGIIASIGTSHRSINDQYSGKFFFFVPFCSSAYLNLFTNGVWHWKIVLVQCSVFSAIRPHLRMMISTNFHRLCLLLIGRNWIEFRNEVLIDHENTFCSIDLTIWLSCERHSLYVFLRSIFSFMAFHCFQVHKPQINNQYRDLKTKHKAKQEN